VLDPTNDPVQGFTITARQGIHAPQGLFYCGQTELNTDQPLAMVALDATDSSEVLQNQILAIAHARVSARILALGV
jgi:hypothetical protein